MIIWLVISVLFTIRDWFPKFANGLNIKIDVVHKVHIWVTKVSFCQNDPIIGESFWQKNSLVTHIFWTMPILIFCQFANFGNQSLFKAKKKFPDGTRLRPGWIVPLPSIIISFWTLCFGCNFFSMAASDNFSSFLFLLYFRALDLKFEKWYFCMYILHIWYFVS